MKNILVTGGEGFIGKHLVKKLKSLGHNVMTVDLSVDADYTFDICDATNFHVLDNIDIDIVYHLAAQSYGKGSLLEPEKDIDWNAKGTLNICRLAKLKNVKKIIYSSSMAIYGNKEVSKEKDNPEPLSNYGVSKLTGEFYIKKSDIDYTIFRLYNTYGRGQDLSNYSKGVVLAFASQIALGKTNIKVTGDLNRFRDIIYIDDVINALVLGIKHTETNNKIYNLSTNVKTTIKELINIIIQASNKQGIKIINTGSLPGDQFGNTGDNTKLLSLGWKPKTNLKTPKNANKATPVLSAIKSINGCKVFATT